MQLKKIQGYLHRAQTIVKEVRIQQVLFPVSLTRLDRVPTPSTDAPSPRDAIAATFKPAAGPGEGRRRARSQKESARGDGDEGLLGG